MNRHVAIRTLLLLLCAACAGQGPAVGSARAPSIEDPENLAAIARNWLRDNEIPGAVALVVQGSDTLLDLAEGAADLENGVPVRAEGVFRAGSLTKQFTAALVLKLAAAGRLRLEDPIRAHLPDLALPASVTIERLLAHTAGVPDFTTMPRWRELRTRALPHDSILALIRGVPLTHEPGSAWAYSNTGYYLLGMLIERVGGDSFESTLAREITGPLGLESTGVCGHARIVPHRVRGYQMMSGALHNAEYVDAHSPFAAGALCSTARDLLRWTDALWGGEVIAAKWLERMRTPAAIAGGSAPYGLGVRLEPLSGHERVWHGGGISGFESILMALPGVDVRIVIMVNRSGVRLRGLAESLAEYVLRRDAE